MTRWWVANASPLILLGKVGQIVLLRDLADELAAPVTFTFQTAR